MKRIQLEHTRNEWNILESEAIKMGYTNFRHMLSETFTDLNIKLPFNPGKRFPGCTDCNKRANQYDVPIELMEKIQGLSHELCMPATSIIRYYTTDSILFKRLNEHY